MDDSNYPPGVTHRDFGPRVHTTAYITVQDIVSSAIELRGLSFETTATANVVQNTETGEMYVDYLDFKDIYILLDAGPDRLLKIDEENLKSRHPALYAEFIAELKALALKQANKAPDHAWQDENGDSL